MTLFEPDLLTPGITVFSFSFTMLLAAISVSRDRASSLISRLAVSPMRGIDFCAGYTIPCLVVSVLQWIIVTVSGCVIAAITGYDTPSIIGILLSLLCSAPVSAIFIFMGILLGAFLSEKAAPSVSSVFITTSGILGGIWMDVDAVGGIFLKISEYTPFLHSVRLLRSAYAADVVGIIASLPYVCAFSVIFCILSIAAIYRRVKRPRR